MGRIVASALLVIWGLLNIVAGLTAWGKHPSLIAPVAFVLAGAMVAAGAIGLWSGARWWVLVTACGLVGISVAALVSASALHGNQITWSHHVIRLAISSALFAAAWFFSKARQRRADSRAVAGPTR